MHFSLTTAVPTKDLKERKSTLLVAETITELNMTETVETRDESRNRNYNVCVQVHDIYHGLKS